MMEESDIVLSKKLCTTLQSSEKRVRKQALIDFEDFLKKTEPEHHHQIFTECHIQLLNTIRDSSEPVREQSIKFMKFFIIEALPKNDFYLSYLFPVIIERIGTVELIEESEEIRLQLVQFLQAIIEKYSEAGELKQFLNDFVIILRESVRDKYPAIKEASCKCIVRLAQVLPRDFHMQAESLVQPVLTAFSHQRYKIRVEAIKCMGELVLHSQYKALEECAGPMAERLFDSVPLVRRTVAQVAARWLLEYRDRYSFFYKLLPLILTGLNDEVPETRTEAHQLWVAVGLQYEKENEKDLKDRMDYLTHTPKYYPTHLTRPNLGCRVLVQVTVGKLTGPLARELVSWQADVRVRCSQLLCAVALHAEEFLTQHLEALLSAMYVGARDEDERVVVNVIQASELMGIFVPVDTWKKLILPAVEDDPNYGHFVVLAAFIRGTPKEYIMSSLREISQLLADTSITHSRKTRYQRELIKCVDAIQSKYDVELSEVIGQYLFNIIVTITSICDKENEGLFDDSLKKLCSTLEIDNDHELWRKYVPALLGIINQDPKSWTEVTIERCVFESILINSGEAFGENLDVIGNILSDTLDIEADPESRLKTLTALSKAFDEKDVIFKRAVNLENFLQKVLKGVLVQTLVWHAGRTAEAMRTMAASCLLSVLNPGVEIDLFKSEVILRPIFEDLLPLLIGLMEDASYRSRFLAIENLVLLKQCMVAKSCWTNEDLIKIYPEILKRLDDPIDQVRVCAIKSLKLILENSPEEFKKVTFKGHHELLFDTLLTHFDDDEESFQDLVKEALFVSVDIAKEVGLEKLQKHKPLLRNQEGCDLIFDHIKNN